MSFARLDFIYFHFPRCYSFVEDCFIILKNNTKALDVNNNEAGRKLLDEKAYAAAYCSKTYTAQIPLQPEQFT